jgi:hypothetical protein
MQHHATRSASQDVGQKVMGDGLNLGGCFDQSAFGPNRSTN